MASAELTITIERPVEEVFAYVADIKHLPEWVDVIQDSWPTADDLTEVGSTYVVKAKVMGQTMEIPSEVVGYESNHVYAYQSKGMLSYVDTMIFEETENGTLLTERIIMESEGRFARLIDAIKLNISVRSHQKNLEMLRARLEDDKVAA